MQIKLIFKKIHLFLLAIFIVQLVTFKILFSQEFTDSKIIKKYPNGCYLVQIGDKSFLAITEKIEKQMLNMKREIIEKEKIILLKDSLLVNYDNTVAWYDTTIKNMKAYLTELESVLRGYKGLLKDYKKLKEPWVTFKAGLCETRKNYKPDLLMVLGIRQFSAG